MPIEHETDGKGCKRVQSSLLFQSRRRGVSASFQISKVTTTKKAGLPPPLVGLESPPMGSMFGFWLAFVAFCWFVAKHLANNIGG